MHQVLLASRQDTNVSVAFIFKSTEEHINYMEATNEFEGYSTLYQWAKSVLTTLNIRFKRFKRDLAREQILMKGINDYACTLPHLEYSPI